MIVLRETWRAFRLHEGSLLSAAIAFFALLALAPSGVLTLAVLGAVVGKEVARDELTGRLSTFLDADTVELVSGAIERAAVHGSLWATSFSIVLFVLVAARLFWMLRAALNHLWGIRSRISPGLGGLAGQVLRRRLLAFGMVFVSGAALFLSAVGKLVLASAARSLGGISFLTRLIEFGASIAILCVVVALVFKLLPDARIHWRDAMLGALVTTVLALIGAYFVGYAVSVFLVDDTWGAAGSLIALLLWVYYTTQIFFFGAIFTERWAVNHGRGVTPFAHATRLVGESTGGPPSGPAADPAEAMAKQWRTELRALDPTPTPPPDKRAG